MSDNAPRSRWLALTVLSAAMLMTILDGSIVTVAMPTIQRDLGFSPAGLSWTVNAYLIAFGGLLLLAGRLGDLIGRKIMFLVGNAVFTAASVLAAAATGARGAWQGVPQRMPRVRYPQASAAMLRKETASR
ncbi:MFS transporter [Nonomuraea polychroma]|uniref:MFS transporter n=1 Tax=Nonomuraea polychroma TaxID=46176 RepID=UPI003D8BDE98